MHHHRNRRRPSPCSLLPSSPPSPLLALPPARLARSPLRPASRDRSPTTPRTHPRFKPTSTHLHAPLQSCSPRAEPQPSTPPLRPSAQVSLPPQPQPPPRCRQHVPTHPPSLDLAMELGGAACRPPASPLEPALAGARAACGTLVPASPALPPPAERRRPWTARLVATCAPATQCGAVVACVGCQKNSEVDE